MLGLALTSRVLVCRAAVDFRKAHDGLVAVVREALASDPLSGDLFVFFNRRRDRIKVLVWDRNGFWLHYKRLERGTFEALPLDGDGARLELDAVRLSLLLEGVAQKSIRFRRNFVARVGMTARHVEHADSAC